MSLRASVGVAEQPTRTEALLHRNARLTPAGRLLLCQRIEAGWPVAHAAGAMGISRDRAYVWWRRYQAEGAGDLVKLIVLEGQGHNMFEGFFRSQPLVDFAIAKAKAGATK